MNKNKIVYQSTEIIYGCESRSKTCYEYKAVINIIESNKTPILITLKFQDNHPFIKIPSTKIIKAETLTEAFIKFPTSVLNYCKPLQIKGWGKSMGTTFFL